MSNNFNAMSKSIKDNISSLIESGNVSEALSLITQYENIIQSDPDIYSMKAVISMMEGNLGDAELLIRQGLEIEEEHFDLLYNLAYLYHTLEREELSIEYYKKAMVAAKNQNEQDAAYEGLKVIEPDTSKEAVLKMRIPRTSIVILTYNNLKYNKLCIESIRKYTQKGSYEIIVVDNHSTDGTVEWLKQQNDLKTIFNEENLGFPKGCNQGIEAAEKDNDILLLNNDTIVAASWLSNLKKCLYCDEKVGAVGSVTNSCSNLQAIPVQYSNIQEMLEFAEKNNISDPALWEERLRLVGFCMLIKREVIEKVGLLDEIFTPGNFEDDDYSLRIRKEGYRLFLCKDSFIHHFGSASFGKKASSYNTLLTTNREKFKDKWGFDPCYIMDIRKDITSIIKKTTEGNINVLEVGCAAGGTLLDIKNIMPCASLYGIEPNERVIVDTAYFAQIYTGGIEQIEAFSRDFFDYIIINLSQVNIDEIINMYIRIKEYLKDSGMIISVLPKELDIKNQLFTMGLEKIFPRPSHVIVEANGDNVICIFNEDEKRIEKLLDNVNRKKMEIEQKDILSIEQNHVKFTGERLVINNEVKQKYNDVLEEHLARYRLATEYIKGKKVLDAACGAGYGTKMIALSGAMEVIGVDISEESLKNARETYGDSKIRFVYGDVNKLPFDESSFDVIVSFETIEHIKDGVKWIEESARLLKDDGLFIVSTPNRYVTNPGTYLEERPLNSYHQYEYNISEFIGQLLLKYDIVELYGQTIINDHDMASYKVLRQLRKMDEKFIPASTHVGNHELVPLASIKNGQPMYVVAVCRKKTQLSGIRSTTQEDKHVARDNQISNNAIIASGNEISRLFYSFGSSSVIGEKYQINDPASISIGNNVMIKNDCWLNLAIQNAEGQPKIIIDDGCQIGSRFIISVSNKAIVERNVIIGPNVYIADCEHSYKNVGVPIMHQGITSTTNEVVVGEGSWLGINAVIVGNVNIGKGCVIGANSFVTRDIPDYSVAVGSPAKIIKMYDTVAQDWISIKNEKDIDRVLKNRKEQPLISICIPTYNRARHLDMCLQSIFSQIGNDSLFEVYISNNDSPDDTEEVIKKYVKSYSNITYHKHDTNIDGDPNIASTIPNSKGEYIMLHGDDDFFKPGTIYKILNTIINHRECGIFFLNVLNDNKEIKVVEGMNNFLNETSIGAGFISSIVISREEYEKLETPLKFLHTRFNQIYMQYSILQNNPVFCVINDAMFTYAGNSPVNYNFGEVFIKNYIDILNYFKYKGLSEEYISLDKRKILNTTVLPWYKRIIQNNLPLDIKNFKEIFIEYYKNEDYFKSVYDVIEKIERREL